MSEDRTALWAVASAIAFPIVGDRARADDLTKRSLTWLNDQPGAESAPIPWLASHVVAEAVVDPPVAGRTHDARRAHLAASLRAEPVAARVAFALHVLCGYDLETTATLCQRLVGDIELLLAPLAPAATGVGELAEPKPPTVRATASREATAASESHEQRRRWFRPRGGTVATILLLTLSVVAVIYPGGARPSFADPPAHTSCGAGGGPGTAITQLVGPTHRPVRLFIPSGSAVGRAVMLLIGDDGASPEQTVATTGLESAAATEGFVLATLDGSSGSWNAGDARGADDQAYAEAAIDRAGTKGCANTSQLSIVGFGTGAHMAAALACDAVIHPHQLVMIRGTYIASRCVPTQPISVLIDVDQSDTVLPVAGGWGTTAVPTVGYTPSSLADTFDGWSRVEGCGTTSTGEAEPSGVVVSARAGCAAGAQVVARVTSGRGHKWPSEAIGATVRFVSGR